MTIDGSCKYVTGPLEAEAFPAQHRSQFYALRARADAKAAEYAAEVRFDRTGCDVQLFRDLPVSQAQQEAENLLFSHTHAGHFSVHICPLGDDATQSFVRTVISARALEC